MKITHVFHSCFTVETKKAIFVFDYYNGEVKNLSPDKPIYFFASHGHFDHCGKKILTIGGKSQVKKYIFTADIRVKPQDADNLVYIEENQSYELDGIRFHTFHSTDLGVAYLVETDEGNIYHAGDLNWWHWNGESEAFNTQMERDYKCEIAKIVKIAEHKPIDIAFLTLDQRLEDAYDWGMKYFMEEVQPKYVMPMHFFSENFDICQRAERENHKFQNYKSQFIKIEKLNQEWKI